MWHWIGLIPDKIPECIIKQKDSRKDGKVGKMIREGSIMLLPPQVFLQAALLINLTIHTFALLCRRRQWHPTPVLLPGKSHGWRSLEGYSPWGHWRSDMTERLHFHFSLSCFGEGNGNPLQCSCLENPRDEGAWWAAVYGVTQRQTQLKWLSSSSSSTLHMKL